MSRLKIELQPDDSPISSSQGSRMKPFYDAPRDSHAGHHHNGVKNHLFLPACSGDQNQGSHTKQVITNSMMQAYFKMRGSTMGGYEDPLFDWIREREDLPSTNPPADKKKRVSRMLETIDEILASESPSGHTPRDAVFEMNRPKTTHLEVPEDADIKFYQEQKEKADQVLEPDSDDDEAGTTSGRISPCTFLAWSKGCLRWDDDEIKVYLDEGETKRLRPPTPEVPHSAKSDRVPSYMRYRIDQRDEIDGGWMSPHYEVTPNPSIVFTAPGVPDENFAKSANFMGKFSRMNPIAAREIRDHMYGRKNNYKEFVAESEMFSFTEVQEAANHIPGPGMGAQAGATLAAHLAAQWASIATADAVSASLQHTAQQQDEKVKALELELTALRTYLVPHLRHRRAVQEAYQREALERQRREMRRQRIQNHMANYLRDVQHKLDEAHLRAAEAQRRAAGMDAHIEELEDDIAEVLLSVGKDDVAQVYQEVLDFDTWNSVLDSGFVPGVAGGASGGSGGGAAAAAAAAGGIGGEGGVANAPVPTPPMMSPPMPFEIGDGYVEDSAGERTPIQATFPHTASFDFVDHEVIDMLEHIKDDIKAKETKKKKMRAIAENEKKTEQAPVSGETKEDQTSYRVAKREELPIRTSSLAHHESEKKGLAPQLSKENKSFGRAVAVKTVVPAKEKKEDEPLSLYQVITGKKPAVRRPTMAKGPEYQPSMEEELAPQRSKAKSPIRRAVETETVGLGDEDVIFGENNVFPAQFKARGSDM